MKKQIEQEKSEIQSALEEAEVHMPLVTALQRESQKTLELYPVVNTVG